MNIFIILWGESITFERTEANPLEMLYVSVPKLNENEVIVPGSLALRFNIDLSGGHANNFLVDNVGRALVDKIVVKYSGTILQDTVGYDIYKIFEDLFLSQEERTNMLQDGIQGRFLGVSDHQMTSSLSSHSLL